MTVNRVHIHASDKPEYVPRSTLRVAFQLVRVYMYDKHFLNWWKLKLATCLPTDNLSC